jgi:hypothetical protein
MFCQIVNISSDLLVVWKQQRSFLMSLRRLVNSRTDWDAGGIIMPWRRRLPESLWIVCVIHTILQCDYPIAPGVVGWICTVYRYAQIVYSLSSDPKFHTIVTKSVWRFGCNRICRVLDWHSTVHWLVLTKHRNSVRNGSKWPGLFQVQFQPGAELLHWVLPHKNPDCCHWAGFTTKNSAI